MYPIKITNQEEFIQTFYKQFILSHGTPEEILSNSGLPFNTLFSKRLSDLLGSQQLLTPAYHPGSNGIVERFMKLPSHTIVHGRRKQNFDHYKSPSQELTIELQERLNTTFNIVDSLKKTNNQQEIENPYQVGNQVLLFNQAITTKNKQRKLLFDWYGPFTVTRTYSRATCDLKHQDKNKLVLSLHISRLKELKTIKETPSN
ncbi:hypothetical protein RMATCC62417_15166 [Rhizopus microsporus]|nr:hypothetical protein RMATCC62417_15166 [Rhizopus microsporus]